MVSGGDDGLKMTEAHGWMSMSTSKKNFIFLLWFIHVTH